MGERRIVALTGLQACKPRGACLGPDHGAASGERRGGIHVPLRKPANAVRVERDARGVRPVPQLGMQRGVHAEDEAPGRLP